MSCTSTSSSSAPCVTEVLEDQLYLGNLQVALSAEQKETLSITHIVSVCPEYPSTGRQHLYIPVQDTEYDDLLAHLPESCSFIEDALSRGGRVLVHCVMGISRSATVVAAFLMKTQKLSPSAAIKRLKYIRPQVHPNYGFIKQLCVFAKCHYNPTSNHPGYKSWKRRHAQDVTYFLNHIEDTVSIIPNKLLLSSDFPSDPEQAQSLLLDIGVTHLVSLSPAEISSAATLVTNHHHISINGHSPEALLLALPDVVSYIQNALKEEGNMVLVHCLIESRVCIAASAYLMASQKISPARASAAIQEGENLIFIMHALPEDISASVSALPLFNPTRNFTRHLEVFQACAYAPKASNLAVRDFIASEKTPKSQIGAGTSMPTRVTENLRKSLLGETQLDLHAFGDTLKPVHTFPYAMRSSVTS
ncbi:hypothetical protein D9619_000122 [Psilocybe cf. subviscida]|uniref:protein-tyrosine-phosphatase n=1 Tax=Psilocybe cf. subviscida TaxID=2480587 RepID=A0A8H5BFL1_9AGAR|nr:hypothetical protein D9619_000122 [Psilocybe cf. subviscida]